jgi:hypothetical protein
MCNVRGLPSGTVTHLFTEVVTDEGYVGIDVHRAAAKLAG